MTEAFIPPAAARALPRSEQKIEMEIEAIDVGNRLRLVNRDKVRELAASINERGLIQPIAVAYGERNRAILVDGEHRLEAHRLIGRSTIAVIIREMTALEREAHEIHANLIRNELHSLDRKVFVSRLAEIFEAENPDAAHGGDRKSRKYKEQNQLANIANWSAFDKEAARRTGLSERSIRLDRELISDLSPAVISHLRRSPFADNQAQIMALAKQLPDHRLPIAEALATGQHKSVQAAKIALGLATRVETDPQADFFRKLVDIWSRANAKTRRMFCEHAQLAEAPKSALATSPRPKRTKPSLEEGQS